MTITGPPRLEDSSTAGPLGTTSPVACAGDVKLVLRAQRRHGLQKRRREHSRAADGLLPRERVGGRVAHRLDRLDGPALALRHFERDDQAQRPLLQGAIIRGDDSGGPGPAAEGDPPLQRPEADADERGAFGAGLAGLSRLRDAGGRLPDRSRTGLPGASSLRARRPWAAIKRSASTGPRQGSGACPHCRSGH